MNFAIQATYCMNKTTPQNALAMLTYATGAYIIGYGLVWLAKYFHIDFHLHKEKTRKNPYFSTFFPFKNLATIIHHFRKNYNPIIIYYNLLTILPFPP